MTVMEIATWRETTWSTADLAGFEVEATDGGVGKVDDKTRDVQTHGFLVVDTGPWILGKKVVIPAGLIREIDLDSETVYLDRTKDEIKNAPEFDAQEVNERRRAELSGYYEGRGGRTAPGAAATEGDDRSRR